MRAVESQNIAIPKLGFGTYRMFGAECEGAVASALSVGFRHIDMAEMYQNESAVGAAIASSGIPRDELFVTTKVWHENLTPAGLHRSFDASLERLRLDRVDLYMIHWPSKNMDLGKVLESMLELRDQGLTDAIGVCNFNLPLLRAAVEDIGAPIACVQVEYHAFLDQSSLLGYLRTKNIPLVAHAPLAQGRAAENDTLEKIARKYGATAAQVAIAWLMDQDDVIAIPKSRSRERQLANIEAVNIDLDDEDRAIIAGLPKDERFVRPPFSPDWDAP
jgi:2,5-diketo-D-gluconate reductase B